VTFEIRRAVRRRAAAGQNEWRFHSGQGIEDAKLKLVELTV